MQPDSESAFSFRFLRFAPTLVGALGAVLANITRADPPPAPAQPLDLKPGSWEIQLNVATSGMIPRLAPESIQALTASMTPEERSKFLDDLEHRQETAEQDARRGRDRIGTACPLRQDFETRIEANLQGERCTRTIHSTAQELHLYLLCPALHGIPETERRSDFERIDPENFRGTIQIITRSERTETITETYLGHWRGEACQNGATPAGPENVAARDPDRIVALIDGQSISARQGMALIASAPPTLRRSYEGRLPELLQRLYMQNAIVAEAVRLHLDREPPWDAKLQNAGRLMQAAQNAPDAGNTSPALQAQLQNARGRILWDAFFSQHGSLQGRQSLFEQQQQKYRITVQDPDFFGDPGAP